jgi:hypothetical protein
MSIMVQREGDELETTAELALSSVKLVQKRRSTTGRFIYRLHLDRAVRMGIDNAPSSGKEEDEWIVDFEFKLDAGKRFWDILRSRPIVSLLSFSWQCLMLAL